MKAYTSPAADEICKVVLGVVVVEVAAANAVLGGDEDAGVGVIEDGEDVGFAPPLGLSPAEDITTEFGNKEK